jgi:hypothetical protein
MVSISAEFARYDTHINDEGDLRYQNYLSSIVNTAAPHLSAKDRGLDFGCGRTKLLARIFDQSGIETESYDIHYFPDEEIWNRKYDFIVLSEVIEHLRDPLETMIKLKTILNQSGKIFVKTKLLPEDYGAFKLWYYKNDPTHVQFFNQKSMELMARRLEFGSVIFLEHDLSLIKA